MAELAPVTTALIQAAGRGSRLDELTQFTDKPMVRLGDAAGGFADDYQGVPMLDFVLSDLALGGVSDCLVVVGDRNTHIRDHYGDTVETEALLKRQGGLDRLVLSPLAVEKVNLSYVTQTHDMPYGDIVPVHLGAAWLKDRGEPQFFVAAGDIFAMRHDGRSLAAELALTVHHSLSGATVGFITAGLERDEAVGKYGIAQTERHGTEAHLRKVIDCPTFYELPLRPLRNASKYLLDRALLDCIDEVLAANDHETPEPRVTDALNVYVKRGLPVLAVPMGGGVFIDCGTPDDLARASAIIAEQTGR